MVDDEAVPHENSPWLLASLTPCTLESAPSDERRELVEEQAANSLRWPAFWDQSALAVRIVDASREVVHVQLGYVDLDLRDQSALAVRIVNASWQVVDVQLRYVSFDDLHLGSTGRSAARAADHPVVEQPNFALFIWNDPLGRHDRLDAVRYFGLFSQLARGCVVGLRRSTASHW